MSMSYPFVFKPVIIDDICYIDGGIMNNFPLNKCLEHQKCSEDDVLAFKTTLERNDETVKNDSTMADYIYILFKKLHRMIIEGKRVKKCKSKYTVNCLVGLTFNDWVNVALNEDRRRDLVNEGNNSATKFYNDTISPQKKSL